jgi:dihydroorotate dehydrogenase (fumarate)
MLETEICKIRMGGPFTNGSGNNDDSLEKLSQLAASGAGFITTKTTTFAPRAGNPGPRFYVLGDTTINSMGLPNPGYLKMAQIISELKTKTEKPVFASISGFNVEESGVIAKEIEKAADVLEINLSCPNLSGKSQIIYDTEMTQQVLREVRKATAKPIAVKAAPFLDPSAQEAFCETAKKCGVDAIVAINAVGNSMYIDPDRAKIMLKPKWGGLGGAAIRMIGIGNVRRYHEYFKGKMPIVGCGGIMNGKDAFAYALAGASAFACGSALYSKEGVGIFAKMESELSEMLKKHNFAKLGDAIGKAGEF